MIKEIFIFFLILGILFFLFKLISNLCELGVDIFWIFKSKKNKPLI